MIDDRHHVELGGVKYRIAQDAEGNSYDLSGEPLRPPNAVMVQGTGAQDQFQARPDMLLWSIGDWSGGEGLITYDASKANQHAILHNVDPFIRPGTLTSGYHISATQDSTDAADFALKSRLALSEIALRTVVLSPATPNQNTYNDWSNYVNGQPGSGYWGASVNQGGSFYTAGVPTVGGVDADDEYIYVYETAAGKLWRLSTFGGAASELMANTVLPSSSEVEVQELGDYVYVYRPLTSGVWEVPKSGTMPVTPVLIWSDNPYTYAGVSVGRIVKGAGKIYIMQPGAGGWTSIVEITPTSAAGPGFGKEIARLPGFYGDTLWWHSGTLFMGGRDNDSTENERLIMYLVPGGDYGSVGRIRVPSEEDYDGKLRGSDEGSLLLSYFLTTDTTDASRVWAIDTPSGGYAQLGELASGLELWRALPWKGALYFSGPTDNKVWQMWQNRYRIASSMHAITPWHNMGLNDEKILSSVVLSCAALPANWAIRLSYTTNGGTSYTTIGTYSTTGGFGTRYAVSTDSSTINFRTMRLKIEFVYTPAGAETYATTRPVVYGVDVRAQVAQPQRVWNLMLDLSDDHGNSSQSHVGSLKYTNIATAGQSKAVKDFKEGYSDRRAGVYTQYDVIIDSYHLVLDRPGEGVAYVSLREVA